MPQDKKPLLLISLFLVAFYASSTGYADKTFMKKKDAPKPAVAAVVQPPVAVAQPPKTMEPVWPNIPAKTPVMPIKTVEPMKPMVAPALESKMQDLEKPNHPKNYVR